MSKLFFILTSSGLLFFNILSAQKTTVEQVTQICKGLDASQKPIVAILPFKVTVQGADQAVGTGLPDMLSNALLNTGCYSVAERDRLDDIMKEQGLGMSGAGDESTFASVGKLIGAQVLVTGTVTEFTENESGGGGGGGGLVRGLKGKLGVAAGGVGVHKSHIGYILKFINPTNALLLDQKSFDITKTSVGAAGGGGIFGSGGGGGGFYSSKSMQDAVEESLIQAVQYMSTNKDSWVGSVKPNSSASSVASSSNKDNCPLLKVPSQPSIMVVLPEEHIAGTGSNYNPYYNGAYHVILSINQPAQSGMGAYISTEPCQAGETAIEGKLTEFGLHLKDNNQLEKLKSQQSYQDVYSSTSDASKLGSKFGADIIVVGEALSEYSKNTNGMVSCRATVSIKAVMTKDGSIIASQSVNAGGMDVSEIVAGKTALKNAGEKIADYLLNQFCAKTNDIVSYMGKQKTGSDAQASSENELTFNNVDFDKLTSLNKMLKAIPGVTDEERTSFSNSVAKFNVTYKGDIYSLLEKISNNTAGIKLKVSSVGDDNSTTNIDVK